MGSASAGTIRKRARKLAEQISSMFYFTARVNSGSAVVGPGRDVPAFHFLGVESAALGASCDELRGSGQSALAQVAVNRA